MVIKQDYHISIIFFFVENNKWIHQKTDSQCSLLSVKPHLAGNKQKNGSTHIHITFVQEINILFIFFEAQQNKPQGWMIASLETAATWIRRLVNLFQNLTVRTLVISFQTWRVWATAPSCTMTKAASTHSSSDRPSSTKHTNRYESSAFCLVRPVLNVCSSYHSLRILSRQQKYFEIWFFFQFSLVMAVITIGRRGAEQITAINLDYCLQYRACSAWPATSSPSSCSTPPRCAPRHGKTSTQNLLKKSTGLYRSFAALAYFSGTLN